jgi:CheY-like chemotaxis protein
MHCAPILIAEDDDDDFFFFRRAARAAGLESPILRFRDGSELIAFIQKDPREESATPLLLFVDLTMPLVNGFAVLEWIKAHAPHRFIPIVLSGSRREDDMKKAFDLGAEEYLAKPVAPVVLAAIAARPAVAA